MGAILAGELRHLITITIPVKSGTGDRGQDIYSTNTFFNVGAKIEPLSGRKLELARQLVATATHEITIRYIFDVVPEAMVTFNGRTFNVGLVRNMMETNFEMVLIATEKQ